MVRSLLLSLGLVFVGAVSASDWPQWRGPKRDGVAKSFPQVWPEKLPSAWRVEVGEGYSGPVMDEARVYVHARQGDSEVVRALDRQTGREVWKQSYPVSVTVDSAAASTGLGPKATPCLADGRLYTFGLSGILTCFTADQGRVVWRQTFDRFRKRWPLYGASTSPLIYDGLCIIWAGGPDAGAMYALDAKTGQQRWANPLDGPGYASPIVVTVGGQLQLITQSQRFLVALDSKTGRELWKQQFVTGYDQNSVTPLVVNDLLIYSGYQKSLYAGKLAKGRPVTPSWELREHPLYMSSPVVVDDTLYGVSMKSGATLVAVNLADGQVLWQRERVDGSEYASLTVAGRVLLLLNTAGEATVLAHDRQQFRPLRTYQLGESSTWAHPALAADVLITKDKTHVEAWRLKSP